jgi:hypothetical protein
MVLSTNALVTQFGQIVILIVLVAVRVPERVVTVVAVRMYC